MVQSDSSTTLPASQWTLPIRGPEYRRAPADLLKKLEGVSSATACSLLQSFGIRHTFVNGPRPLTSGRRLVGSALTLQFMPRREDIGSGEKQEYTERRTALWGALESISPGDVLVVQAYGSTTTGCIGDMLTRYLRLQGGVGIVVDGCVRDSGKIRDMEVPVWCRGTTPHFASQSELFPWAYDVPIACAGVLVIPGDIVVADDDGAVVIPQGLADRVVEAALSKEDSETFGRERLDAGGALQDYYPLSDRAREEFEAWKRNR
jgi:regulator of RNase E activity RraA